MLDHGMIQCNGATISDITEHMLIWQFLSKMLSTIIPNHELKLDRNH